MLFHNRENRKPKSGSRARFQIIEKKKKELINIMASSENRDIAGYCDHIVDAAMMETEFKNFKARAKSIFTRSRNKPAFAAMHGPHSLVRFGPGCADRA